MYILHRYRYETHTIRPRPPMIRGPDDFVYSNMITGNSQINCWSEELFYVDLIFFEVEDW